MHKDYQEWMPKEETRLPLQLAPRAKALVEEMAGEGGTARLGGAVYKFVRRGTQGEEEYVGRIRLEPMLEWETIFEGLEFYSDNFPWSGLVRIWGLPDEVREFRERLKASL